MMLVLMLLAQPLNLNVQPIEVRQNGVRVPTRQRQYVVDCRAGMTCTVDGGILFMSSGDGGAVVTASNSNITLYVDQDQGTDANDCLDAGIYACATITRAIDQLPYLVRHTTIVNVAAGADGGVRDYSGFNLPNNMARRLDGGTAGITISGTLGRVDLDAGVNFALITQRDAGGIQTDGGTFPDGFAFTSVTVDGGDWVDGGLRGYFVRLTRYDGGTLLTMPIWDNTVDTIFPAENRPSATLALAGYAEILEPKTRITTAGANNSLLIVSGLTSGGVNVTMRNFDLVPPSTANLIIGPGVSMLWTNVRMYYGNVLDSLSLPQDGTLTINSCVMISAGSRYFITGSGRGSSFSVLGSLILGGSSTIFSRMNEGQYDLQSNTFYGLLSPLVSNGVGTCPTRGEYDRNRFINMGYGIYGEADQCPSSINIGSNVYDNITNDAIYLSGNVSTTTNVGSALFVHSDSRNVGGYGVRAQLGARGHFVRSATYGNSPTGTLGDIGLGGIAGVAAATTYSSDFLLTFPVGAKAITEWVYGSQIRIVGTP